MIWITSPRMEAQELARKREGRGKVHGERGREDSPFQQGRALSSTQSSHCTIPENIRVIHLVGSNPLNFSNLISLELVEEPITAVCKPCRPYIYTSALRSCSMTRIPSHYGVKPTIIFVRSQNNSRYHKRILQSHGKM